MSFMQDCDSVIDAIYFGILIEEACVSIIRTTKDDMLAVLVAIEQFHVC